MRDFKLFPLEEGVQSKAFVGGRGLAAGRLLVLGCFFFVFCSLCVLFCRVRRLGESLFFSRISDALDYLVSVLLFHV